MMKQENRKDCFFLCAIILLFALLRLPTLYEPFGRDQGIFATIASGLLEGKIPYRDLWDHKPPGIYFLYALVFKLLGREMKSISLFDGLYTIFTLLLLFKLARELFGRRTAYLTTIIFTFLSSGIFFAGWWGRGQPEVFMLFPLLGMIYLLKPFEGRGRSLLHFFFAGILGGIILSLKTTIVPFIFLCSIFLLSGEGMNRRGIKKGSMKVLLFSSGLIISLLPIIIFFGMNKAWNDLFYSNATFNLAAHTHHPYDLAFLKKFTDSFRVIGTNIHFLWLTITLLALYGFVHLARNKKRERALLILWVVGTILSICLGWWLFYYHFIILIPLLALFAAHGFFQIFDCLSSRRNRTYQTARNLTVSFFTLFLLLEFSLAYHRSYVSTGIIPALFGREEINADELYARYRFPEHSITDFSVRENYRLSQYIKAHTRKGEKIFVWGWESLIYFLSEREPASRYIFIYPLIQSNPDMRREARKIFWKELQEKKPSYFIMAKKDQNLIDEMGSEKRLFLFPELVGLLKNRYEKEGETERFVIYRKMP